MYQVHPYTLHGVRQDNGLETIQWLSGAARLDMSVAGQSSFVPRFIEQRPPPKGSRRRKFFPSDKNELSLATAWQFVEQGRRVFIYCPQRTSVEALGKHVLNFIGQGLLMPLQETSDRIRDAVNTGTEWLGGETSSSFNVSNTALLCIMQGCQEPF